MDDTTRQRILETEMLIRWDAPPSMRSPFWRWTQAVDFNANRGLPLQMAAVDRDLHRAAEFARLRCGNWNDKRRMLRLKKFRSVRPAHHFYTDDRPDGWRWVIEAMILGGASDEDISGIILPREDPDVFATYRKTYLDVDLYLKNPTQIMTNVFAYCRNKYDQYTSYDLLWKLFSFHYGWRSFLNMHKSMLTGDPEYYSMLDEVRERADREAEVGLALGNRNNYGADVVAVLNRAKPYWRLPPDVERQLREGADNGEQVLSMLIGNVNLALMQSERNLERFKDVTPLEYQGLIQDAARLDDDDDDEEDLGG